jgi:hypothetical protein
MARDKTQRLTLVRFDDDRRRSAVVAARRLIYEKNYRVNAAAIEGLLKDHSLVPTTVCCSCFSCVFHPSYAALPRIRFQPDSGHWDLTFSAYFSPTSCMTSNWVNGETYLFISSVYWSRLIGHFWVNWIVGEFITNMFFYTRPDKWHS